MARPSAEGVAANSSRNGADGEVEADSAAEPELEIVEDPIEPASAEEPEITEPEAIALTGSAWPGQRRAQGCLRTRFDDLDRRRLRRDSTATEPGRRWATSGMAARTNFGSGLPVIVGIAGGSGSGKTTIAESLVEQLNGMSPSSNTMPTTATRRSCPSRPGHRSITTTPRRWRRSSWWSISCHCDPDTR